MQKIKIVQSSNAPAAVGPYSQALIYGDFVYCSGQIGINPKDNTVVVGLENQTHQIFTNIKAVLIASKSRLDLILKTTIYLSDMNNYAKVNEIYGSYFAKHKPARVTVEVSRLPKDVLIEIDAIAVVKK